MTTAVFAVNIMTFVAQICVLVLVLTFQGAILRWQRITNDRLYKLERKQRERERDIRDVGLGR